MKAVIFDWGGVLIDNPVLGLVTEFSKKLDMDGKDVLKFFNENINDFDRGKISEEEFWEGFGKKPGKIWKSGFEKAYSEKKEIFELARELKSKGIKVGFLSNTEKPSVEFFKEQGHDMFDAEVFSCDEGVLKPAPEIYEIILKRLGVKASEAVFIDDRIDNVKGFEALGGKGILFESVQQIKEELEKVI
ncbi:hypothetical protein CMI47_17495 [Candidatus Pacearchaeota archaeon]|nr:hypothetical protein [Candidatus Pacearchaeota archaeon]|tara:strand:+ start:9261 stop:9827 length:567 start_codon:yes stop_codon:yes gene_type:complete